MLKAACGISLDAAEIAFNNLGNCKTLEIDGRVKDSFKTYITIHQRRSSFCDMDI